MSKKFEPDTALISDIHGNYSALKAVEHDMPDVENIIFVGDAVGYGPRPGRCLDWLRENTSLAVQGNHDRYVSEPRNRLSSKLRTYSELVLNDEQKKWLENLPKNEEFEDYLITHSHPEDEVPLFPGGQSEKVFSRYIEHSNNINEFLEKYNGVIFGHTHIQTKTQINRKEYVNPGVVGVPRPSNIVLGNRKIALKPQYALFDSEKEDFRLRNIDFRIMEKIKEQL